MNRASKQSNNNCHHDKLIKNKASETAVWQPDLSHHSGPKYKALADAIEAAISTNELTSGERLPTHRALADKLGVTIGTVTRGYTEAERRRLVVARVGSGTYVLGKTWETRDFSVPPEKKPGNDVIDLTLSLTVPARREHLLAETLQSLANDPQSLSVMMDYHPETGLPRHREAMVRWLRNQGVEAEADNIIITSGGQQATAITPAGTASSWRYGHIG